MPSNPIPEVKFADPEAIDKMFNNESQESQKPSSSPNANDFSIPPSETVTADTDKPKSSTAAPSIFDRSAAKKEAMPGMFEKAEEPELDRQPPLPYSPAEELPETKVDGPDMVFCRAYAELSKVQRKVVDNMADMLDFNDLFKHRKFFLNYEIVPGKLKVKFASMTDSENRELWANLRDKKLSNLEFELIVNFNKCLNYVVAINDSPVPDKDRSSLFASFDTSFINMLATYISLFELAKLKVLYHNFLEVKGI